MVDAHTSRLDLTLNELKDYAETLVAIKAKGDSSSQLPAACAAGTALLLRVREQERLAALHLAGIKEESASQRNKLDHDSLQLHNLVYEQQYYDKEIAASRAFKSAYSNDQIGCYADYNPQQQSESDVLLAELQQRQALQQQLQQLQQQKEQLLRERDRVGTSYADLKQQVEQHHTGNTALVGATQPSRSNIRADAEAAQLLPLPLYIIYTQAATAANVVGLPLSVSIEGNPAVAKQQLQQQLQQQQGTQPGGEDGQAAAAAQDSKRKRKQLQQEDQAYLLHPLSVRLDMCPSAEGSDSQLSTTLTFFHYTQLKLVGVLGGTPEDQELVTNLFLGDVGDGLMLENVGVCSSSGALQFAEAGRPCPFRWAQELGGVDVLASLPSSLTGIGSDPRQVLSALSAYRNTLRLETFVDRLMEAKRGRQQLKRILEQLALKEQPPCSLLSKFAGHIKTYIHSWKHLSDVGVQLQAARELMRLEAEAGRMPAWQPQAQQHSIQEEGEVAGDAGDITSLLLPGETAEEDLLQGLLDDDRAMNGNGVDAPAVAAAAAAKANDDKQQRGEQQRGEQQQQIAQQQQQQQQQDGGEEGVVAEDQQMQDFAGVEDGMSLMLTEASVGSELLPGEGPADPAAAGSSGQERALLASHSLYRLVLKAPALEVHLHAKVYYNYPLCPPVFNVTKMLDISSRGDPVALVEVNEALKLQQQANCAAVQDGAASGPGQVLALQVLRLRHCVDAMSAQLRTAHSKDLVDNLKAKQALQGRDRQPRMVSV